MVKPERLPSKSPIEATTAAPDPSGKTETGGNLHSDPGWRSPAERRAKILAEPGQNAASNSIVPALHDGINDTVVGGNLPLCCPTRLAFSGSWSHRVRQTGKQNTRPLGSICGVHNQSKHTRNMIRTIPNGFWLHIPNSHKPTAEALQPLGLRAGAPEAEVEPPKTKIWLSGPWIILCPNLPRCWAGFGVYSWGLHVCSVPGGAVRCRFRPLQLPKICSAK